MGKEDVKVELAASPPTGPRQGISSSKHLSRGMLRELPVRRAQCFRSCDIKGTLRRVRGGRLRPEGNGSFSRVL